MRGGLKGRLNFSVLVIPVPKSYCEKYIIIYIPQLVNHSHATLEGDIYSAVEPSQDKLQSRHELVRVLRRRGLPEALHGEEQEQEEEEQEGLRGENSFWKPSKSSTYLIFVTDARTVSV